MTGPHSHGTPPDAPGHDAARGIGPGLVALVYAHRGLAADYRLND